jgi:hypothetical protein
MRQPLFSVLANLVQSGSDPIVAVQILRAWKTQVIDAIDDATTLLETITAINAAMVTTRSQYPRIWGAASSSGYSVGNGAQFDTLLLFLSDETLFDLLLLELETYFSIIPANTVAPVVSGDDSVGGTLNCTAGTWSGTAATYSYQWQRNTGTWVNIAGATAATRVLDGDDETRLMRCVVTATNAAGSASANSNSVVPIQP